MDGRELKTRDAMKRNYGVDLLRLLAMFMVLCLHVYGHGGILEQLPRLSLSYEAAWLAEIFCLCCVNCYMLISGYVGCRSDGRRSRLAALWLRVVYYSVLLTALAQLLYPGSVTGRDWLSSILPVLFNRYWFFTAYFAVYLLMPILNSTCRILDKKQLEACLLGLLVFFSVFPTLLHQDPFMTGFGNSALWFAFVYLVGAYLRCYPALKQWRQSQLLLLYLGSCGAMWLSKLMIELTSSRIGNHLLPYCSPLVLLCAVALLLLFTRMKISDGLISWIKRISPLAFSVYLIHEHPLFREHVIGRLSFLGEYPLPLLLLGHLAAVLALYVFCLSVDAGREALFRRLKIGTRLRELEEKRFPELWKN